MKKHSPVCLLFTEVFRTKGGIPTFNQHFIDALGRLQDYRWQVFSLNDTAAPAAYAQHRSLAFHGCGSTLRIIKQLRFVWRVFYYVLVTQPQFIVCGHINLSPLCLLLKYVFRIPFVTIAHGIEVWHIDRPSRRKALLASKVIVTVSRFTRMKIQQQFPSWNGTFYWLPNTVDTKRFVPGPKPDYLLERYQLQQQKVILTICRLDSGEAYKGYDKVIMALAEVRKACDQEVCYLIGGQGDDTRRIRALISKYGLADRVKLIGFIPADELVDHYNLCDVFIMPSKGEGFGIVFLEALACGKPVIAANQDGSVDALLNGQLGVLVDPDSIPAIAAALIKVLQQQVATRLVDPWYLRQTVAAAYGLDKFPQRVWRVIALMRAPNSPPRSGA